MKKSIISLAIFAMILSACPNLEPGPEAFPTAMPDTTPPAIPAVVGPEFTNNSRPSWSWNIPQDTFQFRYKLDSEQNDWTIVSSSVTNFIPDYDLEDGQHTLYVQAGDKAQNWSQSGSFTILIDLTAPDAPLVTGENLTNNSKPTWNWVTPIENSAIRYRVNQAPWTIIGETTITSYTPSTNLNDGFYTFEVQVQDDVGNWSPSGIFSTTIDTTPPDVPLVSGVSITNSVRPMWNWNISESTINFRYQLDSESGDWTIVSNEITEFCPDYDLSEGLHILYCQAGDQLNNWSASGSYSIIIDISAPVSPVVTGLSPTKNSKPTWSWDIPDGAVAIRYRLNSGAWIEVNHNITTTYTPPNNLNDGSYTLEVQARDAGNNWSSTGSRTIVIDTAPPTVPAVSGVTITNSTRPSWTWNTPISTTLFRYQLNGESGSWTEVDVTTNEFTPDFDLGDGSHTLYVQASDLLENWSISGSHSIMIDTDAPDSPVIYGDTPTNDRTPVWTWNIPSSAVALRYRLNGANWVEINNTETTSFTPVNNLEDGSYTLEVQAKDAGNNWSPSGSRTILIDGTAPEQPVLNCLSAPDDTTPTWEWILPEDAYQLSYRLDGGGWVIIGDLSQSSFTPSSDLMEGAHTLEIRVNDNVNNWSPITSYAITIDLHIPETPIISLNSPTNQIRPIINWTVPANAASFEYRFNNGVWKNTSGVSITSFTPDYDLIEGNYNFEVRAQSHLGNFSPIASNTITIDLTPPDAPNVQILPNSYSHIINVVWTSSVRGNFDRIRLDGGDWIYIEKTSPRAYSTPVFEIGSVHTLEVQVQDEAGNWSESGQATGEILLSTPRNLKISSDWDKFSINWNSVDGAEYYEIFSSDKYLSVNWNGEGLNLETYVKCGETTETNFEYGFKGNALMKRYFTVRAVKSTHYSFFPNSTWGSLKNIPDPQYDGEFIDKVRMKWASLDRALKYEIFLNDIKIGETTETFFEQFDANSDGDYRLRAISIDGNYSLFSKDVYLSKVSEVRSLTASRGDFSYYIQLSWNGISDAKKYEIYRIESVQGPNGVEYPPENSFKIGESTIPFFKDYSCNKHLRIYMYNVIAISQKNTITEAGEPIPGSRSLWDGPIFENPTGVEKESNRIQLFWNNLEGAVEYSLDRIDYRNGGPYIHIANTTNNFYVDDDVESYNTYQYRLYAISAGGIESMTSLTTAKTSFEIPTDVSATTNNANHVQIAWKSVVYASAYNIYRSEGGNFLKIGQIYNSPYIDETAKRGVNYSYYVKARNNIYSDQVESKKSETVQGSRLDFIGPIITASKGTFMDKVRITWDTLPDAVSYEVYKENELIATITETFYDDVETVPGVNYSYFVYGINSDGYQSEQSATVNNLHIGYKLDRPQNLEATTGLNTMISLLWETIEDAHYYEIYRCTSINGTYLKIGEATVNHYEDYTADTSCYYYKVIAVSSIWNYTNFSDPIKGCRIP